MPFDEVLEKVLELLKRQGRLSYRALRVRFELTDEYLDALKEELLFAYPQVTDEDQRGLVWTEPGAASSPPTLSSSPSAPPAGTVKLSRPLPSRSSICRN